MHYTTSFSLKESGHGILPAHHFLGIPTAPEFQMMPHRGLNLPQIHGWHFFKKNKTLQWVQITRILLKFLEKLPFVLHRNSRSSSPCFRGPSLHHAFGSNPLWPPWRPLLRLPGGVYTKMSMFEDLSTSDFWDWWSTQITKHLPNELKFHWKVSNLDWYAS